MLQLAALGGKFNSQVQLIGGVLLQYLAARVAISVVAKTDGSTPGRLALAQWLPIATMTVAAMVAGEAQVALSVIFGSSVAAMSLVLGMMIFVGPIQRTPGQKRIWPMVLPVAIFLALAGFRAFLTWYHAVMLLVMGAAILAVWLERVPDQQTPVPAAGERSIDWIALVILPAIALAGFGAWITLRGMFNAPPSPVGPELMATLILCPLLLLAALGATSTLAQHGHTDQAITSICGTVLLNLCLLLPALVLTQYAIAFHDPARRPLPFPLIDWRLDVMLLVVLGFALIPVALGRWIPGRLEAVLLIAVYLAYLAAQILNFVRVI